jgi:hypothetical protein
MNKELTKPESNEVMKYDAKELGAASEVTAGDIVIGRIGIMQALSQLVKDKKCFAGDVIDTETEEKHEQPLEFIILKSHKYWVVTENDEYKERFPAIHQNEYPWTEGNIKRMYNHAFYVLLAKDIKDGMLMPYEISFRSTELRVARKISKMLMILGQKNIPSWGRAFLYKVEEKRKGKHSWYGASISPGRETTKEEKEASYKMFMQIKSAEATGNVSHASDDIDISGVEEY